MKEFPRLTWTPCAAHCLDLFLEDIGHGLKPMKDLVKTSRKTIFFIKNHHQALAMFKDTATADNDCVLLTPGATRLVLKYFYAFLFGLLY